MKLELPVTVTSGIVEPLPKEQSDGEDGKDATSPLTTLDLPPYVIIVVVGRMLPLTDFDGDIGRTGILMTRAGETTRRIECGSLSLYVLLRLQLWCTDSSSKYLTLHARSRETSYYALVLAVTSKLVRKVSCAFLYLTAAASWLWKPTLRGILELSAYLMFNSRVSLLILLLRRWLYL